MIKRTLCFTNPAYLSLKNEQLVVKIPHSDGDRQSEKVTTIPIEDIGGVIDFLRVICAASEKSR